MKRPSYVYFLGLTFVVGLIGLRLMGRLPGAATEIRIIGLLVGFPLVYGAGYFLFKGWQEDHVPKEQREAREDWIKSRPPLDGSKGWKP